MSRETLEVLVRLRDQFTPVAERIQQRIEGFGRAFDEAARYSSRFAYAFQAAAGVIAAASVRAYAQLEQLRIGYTTLLGSAEKAEQFIRKLYDFAARTPFEISGLMKQTQLLLALGFQAQQVIPVLSAVGDAVAALGGNAALMDRVVLALGQIRSKGKVSAEEMRQLAEAGIPAWEMLAEKIGVSIPKAMKLAENGAIDATTGLNAIIQGMNERFSGMMQQQSRTILGIWSNLKDNLNITLQLIAERLVKTFRLREAMLKLEEWMSNLVDLLRNGKVDERLNRIADAMGRLAAATAGLLAPGLISQFRAFVTLAFRLVRVLGPWAIAGTAVYEVLKKLGVTMDDLMPVIKRLASGLTGLYNIFSGIIGVITTVAAALLDVLIKAIEAAYLKITAFYRSIANRVEAVQALFDTTVSLSERLARYRALASRSISIKMPDIRSDLDKWAGDLSRAGQRIKQGMSYIADAITGGENDATRATERLVLNLGSVKEELQSAAVNIAGLGDQLGSTSADYTEYERGAEKAAQATSHAVSEAKEAVRWYDLMNDRLDKLRRRIESYANTVGQLGASEAPGEGQYPRSRFPIVSQPGPPTVGGAPLSQLYLTDEQRQRIAQLVQLQDSLRQAGMRTMAITREQAEAYASLQQLLQELEASVAGYAAELDESTYTTARARLRASELYEQYKSLRLALEAVGRSTLHITNREYQQHVVQLQEMGRYTAAYAAELDDTAYAQARQREEMEKAAAAARKLRDMVSRLNATFANLKQTAAAGLADALNNLLEGGNWDQFGQRLSGIVQDGIGAVVDAIIPGMGRIVTALGRLWITVTKKISEWLDSWSARGQERLRKAAQEQQRELARGLALLSANAFSTIKERTQRFLFWTRRTFEVVVNEQARAIAQTLDSAVTGALMRGVRAFLTGAKDWRRQFSDAIKQAILEGVIQAIVQQSIIKGILGPALDKLTQDITSGNLDAARATMDDIMARAGKVGDWIEGTFGRYRAFFQAGQQPAPGLGGPPPEPGVPSQPSIGLTVPAAVLPGFQFQQLIPAFDRLTGAIDRLVDEGVRANVEVTVRVEGDVFGRTFAVAG